MSIRPASDIILDVARAADPLKARAAMERLARIGSDAGEGSQDFAVAMAPHTRVPTSPQHQITPLVKTPAGSRTPIDAQTKASEGIEALVLQRLVETMLPKETSQIFGSGTAGDMWKSMLAEELAKSLGKSIDLGLFKNGLPGTSTIAAGGPHETLQRAETQQDALGDRKA